MIWKKGYFWVVATALFFFSEIYSQTYITPLIGMDLISIKDKYFSLSPNYFHKKFLEKPIPTAVAGLDAEKKIKANLHLYYGISYLSFRSGKRYYRTSLGSDPYYKVDFKNLSQNLGAIYHIFPNIGIGLALNLDYIFDFKHEDTQAGSPPFIDHYPSLLDLGLNLNLRYRLKNWVLKVDYKYRLFSFRYTSEDVPPEIQRPIKPLKGFGVYFGYRFDL